MDKGHDPKCGRAISPHEKPDDENCESTDNAAVEEPNLKPLKKAHYVWQIKGNYHLKNSSHDSEASSLSGAGSSVTEKIMNCNAEPSTSESVNEAKRAPTFCERHSSACQPGVDLSLTNSSEKEYAPLPPLRIGASTVSSVVCDTSNENTRRTSSNVDEEQSLTPPLTTFHPDWNVRKWQTRQVAKANMDNTINFILEEFGFMPVPESAPDSDPDDVLGSINSPRVDDDSVEEEEEDESVENEGILSAIQRHGLQRHTLESFPEAGHPYSFNCNSPIRCSPSPPGRWGPNQQLLYRRNYQGDELLPSPESVSVGSDCGVSTDGQALSPADIEKDETGSSSDSNSDEDADDAPYNYMPPSSCRCVEISRSKSRKCDSASVNSHELLVSSDSSDEEEPSKIKKPVKACKSVSAVSHHKCSSKLEEQEDEISKKRQGKAVVSSSICKRRCMEVIDAYSECSSSSSSQTSQSSQLRTSPGLEGDVMTIASHPSGRNSPAFGHFEFMDAAVAAAIQKKGLSALACQDL